jgi:hypothetical protein
MGLEKLPSVEWPVPSPRKTATAVTVVIPAPVPVANLPASYSRRTFAGLTWAEEGNPFFCCVVTEKPVDVSRSLDTLTPCFEIVSEFSTPSFPALATYLLTLRQWRCAYLFTRLDTKDHTFIRDFNTFKRTNNVNLALKATRSSTFEASLLKIKDVIHNKHLIFPDTSTIKAQLASFSKTDLKNEVSFYAIRALCYVIDAFKTPSAAPVFTEVPNPSAWY